MKTKVLVLSKVKRSLDILEAFKAARESIPDGKKYPEDLLQIDALETAITILKHLEEIKDLFIPDINDELNKYCIDIVDDENE